MYASSEGSGESVHLQRLVEYYNNRVKQNTTCDLCLVIITHIS